MPRKEHHVKLTDEERRRLRSLFRGGTQPVRLLTRARILLLADEGHIDETIVERVGCNLRTVERTRKRFGQAGVDGALHESPRPGAAKKLDDKQAAILVATACSTPPNGRERWTMQMLADRIVELGVVDGISDETVRRALKKTRSSRGSGSNGACRT